MAYVPEKKKKYGEYLVVASKICFRCICKFEIFSPGVIACKGIFMVL